MELCRHNKCKRWRENKVLEIDFIYSLNNYRQQQNFKTTTVMRKVLKNQKRVSAIVALALGAMVTFMAGINSYGVTANESGLVFDFDETALMERAIADLEEVEYLVEEVAVQTIKIYDGSDELIETIYLSEGEEVEDVETQKLLNQAEYLTGFGDTQVYRVY